MLVEELESVQQNKLSGDVRLYPLVWYVAHLVYSGLFCIDFYHECLWDILNKIITSGDSSKHGFRSFIKKKSFLIIIRL